MKGTSISSCHLSLTSNKVGKVAQCIGCQPHAALWECGLPSLQYEHCPRSTEPQVQRVHLGDSEKTLRHTTQPTSREKTSFQSPVYPDKHKIIKYIFIYQKRFRQKMVVQWLRNLPVNAGYVSVIPGRGRFHMLCMRQLSLCVTTTEPTCSYWSPRALEPVLHEKPLL